MIAKQRTTELVVEKFGDESLIYDLTTDQAHRLDADATKVWAALAESETAADVAERVSLSEEIVATTFVRLAAIDLVEIDARETRRVALKRGAALAAVPVIASILAPAAQAAASGRQAGDPCTANGQCASGTCNLTATPPVCL